MCIADERHCCRSPGSPDNRTQAFRRPAGLPSRNLSGGPLHGLRCLSAICAGQHVALGPRRAAGAASAKPEDPGQAGERHARPSDRCFRGCAPRQPKLRAPCRGRTERREPQAIMGTAEFLYKCDELYSPKDEIVVRWNDPAIGIAWGMENPFLSARDAAAPLLSEITNLPVYGQV